MRRRITQSSLPDSLIPHLYSSPQEQHQSLPTDNTNNDIIQQQQQQPTTSLPTRPIYSDPIYYSSNPRLPPLTRRGSSLPPPPRLPTTTYHDQRQQQQQQQQHLPPPHTLLQDSYTSSFPSLESLSISAPTSSSSVLHRFPASPESHQHVQDSRERDTPTNNLKVIPTRDGARKGKKRKAPPDNPDDTTTTFRNPRKTPVACNFCRGRKLRCNGARPACYNCSIRSARLCEYVPVQKRRGPGKHPRGSRGGAKRNANSALRTDPSPSETIPAELVPYLSVIDLSSEPFPSTDFTFTAQVPPPPVAAPYSQQQHTHNDFRFHSPPFIPFHPQETSTSAHPHRIHHQSQSNSHSQQHHLHLYPHRSPLESHPLPHPYSHPHPHAQQIQYHNDPYLSTSNAAPRSREASSEDCSDGEEFYSRRYGS